MKLEKELTYNQSEFNLDTDYNPAEIDKTIKKADDNHKVLKDLAKKSQEKGHKVLGGFFGLNVADGMVYYQVTEIKGNIAFVKRCAGICLDFYQDNVLGQGEWITLNKATELVERNRALEKLFGGD